MRVYRYTVIVTELRRTQQCFVSFFLEWKYKETSQISRSVKTVIRILARPTQYTYRRLEPMV